MAREHPEFFLLQERDTHSIAPKHVEPLLIPKTWEDTTWDGAEEQGSKQVISTMEDQNQGQQ
jgi:hypothetical protein